MKTSSEIENSKKGVLGSIIIFILCILVIGGGWAGANYFKESAPKLKRKAPVQMAPLVEVTPIFPTTERVWISAMGTVVPARELVLKSRVGGQVMRIHPEFVEGGVVKSGEEILRIDATDYELAVAQNKSQITTAEYALKLEMGRQEVAKREWEILGKELSQGQGGQSLALRKPHLEKARADLEAAKLGLKQARINLSRTRIKAPFDALVRIKNVEKGSQVSPQEALAVLVNITAYWVQAPIPVDRLKWLKIPSNNKEKGSPVRILYREDQEREGEVVKLLGDLAEGGRMAKIIVNVPDPLGLTGNGAMPLLISEFVRVKIQGPEMTDTYRIPRTALRDDFRVWIADENDTLSIREVRTIWNDTEAVLVSSGLSPGDKLIVSDIPGPAEGMKLQIRDAS